MPFKTEHGTHYHMKEGCSGATIQCRTEGLTPCSICCGKSLAGDGGSGGKGGSATEATGGAETASAGVGSHIGWEAIPSRPAHATTEGLSYDDKGAAATGSLPESGDNDSPLDAYDRSTDATRATAMVSDGTSGMSGGLPAPQPRYGIPPETLASLTDSLAAFGVEPLESPDGLPSSWDGTETSPDPLPSWDAPLVTSDERWFAEMDAHSPDRLLTQQVAAAISPAMRRWPEATTGILGYGMAHGFMTAPASTCFHLNSPGGLACHSASVTATAIEMMERPENQGIRDELGPDWREITSVVCLWHDACKMDFYEPLEQPKKRADGRVAFYEVAKSRQNDGRHGELSADIVRHFYGDSLPEVAYDAISMHMGQWDHRRAIPKWVSDALDAEVQKRKRVVEEQRRAKKDADLAGGRITKPLQKKVAARRELVEQMRGASEDEAARMIAASGDAHSKRMDILLTRLGKTVGAEDPMEAEYKAEVREMLESYRGVAGADDIAVARGIFADERGHYDATIVSRRERAQRIKEEKDAYAREMERAWEEHPFIRLIHEADATSAALGL